MPLPPFLGGRSIRRAILALTLTLAAAARLTGDVAIDGDQFTASNGNFSVTLSTTGGEVLDIAHREGPDAAWISYGIHIYGERGTSASTVADTRTVPPKILHAQVGSHLIVKYSMRDNGLFWTLWFDLDADANHLTLYRFLYGEDWPLQLRGVGVAIDAPGYTATTAKASYTVGGVGFTGGHIDLDNGTQALRVMISNMDDQTWEATDGGIVTWYRRNLTDFGGKIDYRRMVISPYPSGSPPADDSPYERQFAFDHPVTNVELASNWVVRSKNASGQVRDWFNATDYSNSFFDGTGASTSRGIGFWRDDWTTGCLMRQLRDSYTLTRDPFYLMRLADICDYQLDRDAGRLKQLWATRGDWEENYPMGRVEALLDLAQLTGWQEYQDEAIASAQWFVQVEQFNADGSYKAAAHDNYNDLSYCMEGMYRASELSGGSMQTLLDRWYSYIDGVTWRPSFQLYINRLTDNTPWSRGNGWWMETFSNIRDYYQGSDKGDIHDHYVAAAQRLIDLQDGIWHKRPDSPGTFLDASGGTMIAAGFAQSFLKGDLDASALASSMEAIAYVTKNLLRDDGTIVGTDRGSRSNDPFPYTQEGYVKFAAELGIAEVVSPAARSQLYTLLNDGVFLVDDDGGAVTDSAGHAFAADGQIIVSRFADRGGRQFNLRLMGRGARTITLGGAEPSTTYNIRTYDERTGAETTAQATADASGSLVASVEIDGILRADFTDATSTSPWVGYDKTDGWVEDANLGALYLDFWPFVWSMPTGWLCIPEGQSPWNTWAYAYDEGGWIWMNRNWAPWVYHWKTGSWSYLQ